jgi:carbamoyltransferase
VLLPLTGHSFAEFCSQFDPFRRDPEAASAEEMRQHHHSIAGKAMAYAALGRVEEAAFPIFDKLIASFRTVAPENEQALGKKIAVKRNELLPGLSNADLIATFQAYVGNLLLSRLSALLKHKSSSKRLTSLLQSGVSRRPNLVLVGGCGLNIKWNTTLRNSGLFGDIWIPPFPNDSGAALGTAACEMLREGSHLALDWDVYSGARIASGAMPTGWQVRPCDEWELAEILHTEGEPVLILSGRAEIGPRALGNRSILAPATERGMKDRLNAIKRRASYRPVAPICLATRAQEVFTPGGIYPYMLFEHRLRPRWAERVPR